MIKQVVPFEEDFPAIGVVAGESYGGSAADVLVEVKKTELQGARNIGLIIEERYINRFARLYLEITLGAESKKVSSPFEQRGSRRWIS